MPHCLIISIFAWSVGRGALILFKKCMTVRSVCNGKRLILKIVPPKLRDHYRLLVPSLCIWLNSPTPTLKFGRHSPPRKVPDTWYLWQGLMFLRPAHSFHYFPLLTTGVAMSCAHILDWACQILKTSSQFELPGAHRIVHFEMCFWAVEFKRTHQVFLYIQDSRKGGEERWEKIATVMRSKNCVWRMSGKIGQHSGSRLCKS